MNANDVIIHDSSEDIQPEKYGRTLARDAEMLQRGGVPDFAPLSQTTKEERLATAPVLPIPAKDVSLPRKHTLVPPLVAPIETYVGGSTQESVPATPSTAKDRLVAGSPLVTPPPVPPPPPPPASPLPPQRPPAPTPPLVTPIETYAGDFADMMKKTGASTMTVLAAEQDRGNRSPVPVVPQEGQSRGNLLYVVAGLVLLAAGAAGVYAAYLRYSSALAPFAPVTGAAPIFIDEREQVSGSGATLLKAVNASLARPPAPGAVRLLYGATATTSTSSGQATSIAATLLAKAPDIVRRNMNAGNSMVGIVNVGGSASPFFILSVSSYGNTFSGMLWWEKSMPRDLSALWGGAPSLAIASSTAATISPPVSGNAARGTTTAIASTSSGQATTAARVTGFRDEVIGNHDARVYRDEAGRSILLYGYWDKTTLVLARDPGAFIEILQRLATSRAR